MLATTALTAFLQVAVSLLPHGYDNAKWGTTAAELQNLTTVQKATPGHGFSYSEHAETNPDVYIGKTKDNHRIEYYFFKEKLYKIFIVYDRAQYSTDFYQKELTKLNAKYGPSKKTYQEVVFGIPVTHTMWENNDSILDLRMGAGFVYQVRLNKSAAQSKDRLKQIGDSI